MPMWISRMFAAAALFMFVCSITTSTPARAQTPPTIESAVFEYQALAGNASNIDQHIAAAIPIPSPTTPVDVVIATPKDVGAIINCR